MATKLTKDVKRELKYTRAHKNGRLDSRNETARPVIVILKLNETIAFKIKGCKRAFTLHCSSAFELAKCNFIIQEYNAKMKRYKERKANNEKGIRKPVMPWLPYKKHFFEILK